MRPEYGTAKCRTAVRGSVVYVLRTTARTFGILAPISYCGTCVMSGVTEGVAAVERALSILDAFTDQDPQLTLGELAKRTKMYKSTILRLARSLENYGYLVRAEDGVFRLGS